MPEGIDLDNARTREMVQELEQCILSHSAWLKNLHRALLCRLPPNPDDLEPDAHCRCDFGRWYYGCPHPGLPAAAGFRSLGEGHHTMHDRARDLLHKAGAGAPLEPADYDRFIDLSIAFVSRIRDLQLSMVARLSDSDPLTGIPSRRGMLPRLAQERERSLRIAQPCCVCMMDFDNFKNVNDIYGHQAGDQVLRAAVQFVATLLRKYDSIYRYGGEEFLLCLPDTAPQGAKNIVDRLRAGLEALPIALKDGTSVQVTASFGIAEIDPGASVEEVIARADRAMLAAKDAGRNRVLLWSDLAPAKRAGWSD